MLNAPSAFISYSWESDIHRQWVREFATRLRHDSIDARLDQWDVAPGDQLPEFMETSIQGCDFILMICTPTYKSKADRRQGGVGYEGHVITGEVFSSNDQRKFIPVLRSGSWADSSPSWMRGKYFIDLSGSRFSETAYGQLLLTLTGRREAAPPIGSPRARRQSSNQFVKTDFKLVPTLRETTVAVRIAGGARVMNPQLTHEVLTLLEATGIKAIHVRRGVADHRDENYPFISHAPDYAAVAAELRDIIRPILSKYKRLGSAYPAEVQVMQRVLGQRTELPEHPVLLQL